MDLTITADMNLDDAADILEGQLKNKLGDLYEQYRPSFQDVIKRLIAANRANFSTPSENLKIDLMAIEGELDSLMLLLRKDVTDETIDWIGDAFKLAGSWLGGAAREAVMSFAVSKNINIK